MDGTPKYFSLGLELGLVKPSQVQLWVDHQIRQAEMPSDQLLDLAFLGIENEKEMYRILGTMSDDTDDFDALRNLLSDLEDFPFENIQACAKLTEKLYHLLCKYNCNYPSDFDAILYLDDAFSLAMNGTWGSPDDARKEFKEFVYSFK